MAHRALWARECSDGGYVCYRSRWGGTDRSLTAVCAGRSPGELPVDWTGQREAADFAAVLDSLDYLSLELLYRETGDTTTPFLTFWFGLPLSKATRTPGLGALLGVRSLQDARQLRTEFRELKGVLADSLLRGAVPATWAPLVVRSALVRSGRELYVTVPGGERSRSGNGTGE